MILFLLLPSFLSSRQMRNTDILFQLLIYSTNTPEQSQNAFPAKLFGNEQGG